MDYESILTNRLLKQILERLEGIERKLDDKLTNKYLTISQVSQLTGLSGSTIRRDVHSGRLKCSKKTGKLLFTEVNVRHWIEGQ